MKGDGLPDTWHWFERRAVCNADGDEAWLTADGDVTFAYECMGGDWVTADAPVEVVAALLRAAGWVVTPPGGREP